MGRAPCTSHVMFPAMYNTPDPRAICDAVDVWCRHIGRVCVPGWCTRNITQRRRCNRVIAMRTLWGVHMCLRCVARASCARPEHTTCDHGTPVRHLAHGVMPASWGYAYTEPTVRGWGVVTQCDYGWCGRLLNGRGSQPTPLFTHHPSRGMFA